MILVSPHDVTYCMREAAYISIGDGNHNCFLLSEPKSDSATVDEMLDLWVCAMRIIGYQELSIRRAINLNTARAIIEVDGATGG